MDVKKVRFTMSNYGGGREITRYIIKQNQSFVKFRGEEMLDFQP